MVTTPREFCHSIWSEKTRTNRLLYTKKPDMVIYFDTDHKCDRHQTQSSLQQLPLFAIIVHSKKYNTKTTHIYTDISYSQCSAAAHKNAENSKPLSE